MAQMNRAVRKSFAHHELVTLAGFLRCGYAKTVDLEDVAMEVNRLAPERFTWRKYADQINVKNVDAFLWDAKKVKKGSLVVNPERDHWTLTETGGVFAREKIGQLEGADVAPKTVSAKDTRGRRRTRCDVTPEPFARDIMILQIA
ncbi:MAG: hypothetical protein ACKVVO_11405 [Opitutaceae bacterium]